MVESCMWPGSRSIPSRPQTSLTSTICPCFTWCLGLFICKDRRLLRAQLGGQTGQKNDERGQWPFKLKCRYLTSGASPALCANQLPRNTGGKQITCAVNPLHASRVFEHIGAVTFLVHR